MAIFLKSNLFLFLLGKSGFCASGCRHLSDAVDTEAVATSDREGCFLIRS